MSEFNDLGMENYQQVYEKLHPETKEFSFMTVLEDFIHSAEIMERTVLFPSLLMDLSLDAITRDLASTELHLQNQELDLRGFYFMVKSLKTQLEKGSKFVVHREEQNFETRSKIAQLCEKLTPLIRQARYIGEAGQEIAMTSKMDTTFSQFQQATPNSMPCCLIETLQEFLKEVKGMESEVLFPSLLTGYKASDLGHSFVEAAGSSNREDNLHDLYMRLLQLRKMLLTSQSPDKSSLDLHKSVEQLRNALHCYSSMIDNLVDFYRKEVHDNC